MGGRRTTLPADVEEHYLEVQAQHPGAHVCTGCFTPYATVAEAFACQCPEIELFIASIAGRSDAEGDGSGPRFPEKPGAREAARRASIGDNRYGGTCTECGAWVEPLEGKRAKQGERWTVRHLTCPVVEATPAPVRHNPRDPEPEVVPASNAVKPNRYEAACARCQVLVPAGAGKLAKVDGRWIVTHLEACERPATSVPIVPEGHYAIEGRGDNEWSFYRVDHGTGTYAGRIFVKRVIGGRPDENVPARQVPGILQRIVEDPLAGPRYGQVIGRCCRCNRHLTDDASREAGIGPDCATRD